MLHKTLIISAFMVLSLKATAQDSYAGASFGTAKIQSELGDLAVLGTNYNHAVETGSAGYKFYAGYRFNDTYALEAGYTNYGKSEQKISYRLTPQNNQNNTLSVTAYTLGATVKKRWKRFEPYVKFGIALNSATYEGERPAPLRQIEASVNETGVYGGIGVAYRLNKQMNLVADIEASKLNQTLTDESGNTIIDLNGNHYMLSVGAAMQFE